MQTEHLTFIADFAVQGRTAYLSHQETMSLWQRLLVRARMPLVFSQGFNPRPRISLPLPRSVGVQSVCERLCARVRAEGFCADAARRAVETLLPTGLTLHTAQAVPGKASFYPVAVTYRLVLAAPPDAERQRHTEHCKLQLETPTPIFIQRLMEKGRTRDVDIRPFLESVRPDDATLEVVCAIRPDGTVRVDELLRWLALTPTDLAEPVQRTAVRWVTDTTHFQKEHKTL